jgi:hypothetical protein
MSEGYYHYYYHHHHNARLNLPLISTLPINSPSLVFFHCCLIYFFEKILDNLTSVTAKSTAIVDAVNISARSSQIL